MREFVAIRDAKVTPLSAHTGHGLDSLRTTLTSALSQPSSETPDAFGLEAPEVEEGGAEAEVPPAVVRDGEEDGEEGGVEVVMADAPEGAATATVLDYTSSAKTGKVLVSISSPPCAACISILLSAALEASSLYYHPLMRSYTCCCSSMRLSVVQNVGLCCRACATNFLLTLLYLTLCRRQLVLVDRGILRPGDPFVSGMLWGFVRSIYDEEGSKLLDQAGTNTHGSHTAVRCIYPPCRCPQPPWL